jgi:hypothetical protein
VHTAGIPLETGGTGIDDRAHGFLQAICVTSLSVDQSTPEIKFLTQERELRVVIYLCPPQTASYPEVWAVTAAHIR